MSTPLAPPLFLNSKAFAESGRSLRAVSSPRSNTRCIYPAPSKLETNAVRDVQYESNIYLMGQESHALKSQLVSDTYVQWVKTREFFENEKILPEQYRPLLPETLEGFSMTLKGHIRRLNEEGCSSSVIDHYQAMDAVFDLFLLVTAGKSDPGVFGEDLLDWINRHYVSPTSEEGTALAEMREPWQDPDFWIVLLKYSMRGIIPPLQHFLNVLSTHPSKWLPSIAKKLANLLGDLPRALSCKSLEFAMGRREWVRLLSNFRTEFDGLPSEAEAEDWYPHVRDMLEIFEGDELIIKRIGREYGIGWCEVVCVWGLWGDEQLERRHLPMVVEGLAEGTPPDPEELEDRILYNFFIDNLPKAVQAAFELDAWLGAHLADLMQAEGLISSAPMKNQEISLRDYYVLEYAEVILNDPGQWMIAVDYMQSCGDVGLGMADEVLYRVPLDMSHDVSMEHDPEVEAKHVVESDTVIPLHIVKLCQDHKREWVLENIIRTAARLLADSGRLGESLSYSLTTEDQTGIDRVVSFVMERYKNEGRDSLIEFVNELPPVIQTQYRTPGPRRWQSLSFLLNYAQYLIHHTNGEYRSGASHLVSMLKNDLVPYRWWPIIFKDAEELLTDDTGLHFTEAEAYEIMRKVDISCNRLSQGFSKKGPTANDKRQPRTGPKAPHYEMRLALAKYIARLVIAGERIGP